MKKIYLLFILLLGCYPVLAQQKVFIIPAPQTIEYGKGQLVWNAPLNIVCSSDLFDEANLLKECLINDYKSASFINKTGTKNADITLTIDNKIGSEPTGAYELIIHSKGVNIKAAEKSGIYYGIQSLLQIIHKGESGLALRKLTIKDFPAFQWRAFMLDESRNFKGKEVVEELLDRMGRLKMNIFHWHLTDDQGWRIEIKKYPELTKIGSYRDSTQIGGGIKNRIYDGIPQSGFYTQKDIKEIVKYANERHITVIPEIEMPGHATAAVAAYPWLGLTGDSLKVSCSWGTNYNVFNVASPRVMQFIEDVIDELITLFPSSVIHVGGDEVRYDQWEKSDYVQEYMKENKIFSPSDLQVQFTNRISNLIKSKGKRMIGWNEITGEKLHDFQLNEDKNETIQKLADGTIVQFWKGDIGLIQKTAEKGYDIVNSFHEYTYLDYDNNQIPLEKAYAFSPVPEGLPAHLRTKIVGGGCQMWSEYIPSVEEMYGKIFPRITAYAECFWTLPQNKNYKRFEQSLSYLKSNAAIYPQTNKVQVKTKK